MAEPKSNKMVERVAKSICRRITRHIYPIAPDTEIEERVNNSWREKHWVEAARDAIAAMREVPPEFLADATLASIMDARYREIGKLGFWHACIDAALAEPADD